MSTVISSGGRAAPQTGRPEHAPPGDVGYAVYEAGHFQFMPGPCCDRPGKEPRTGWCEMPATPTQLAVTRLSVTNAWCAALFGSALQPSDAPTADMVAEAITCTVQRLGITGCVGRMAQEFGDHPDTAAQRMRWARQLVAGADQPGPALAPSCPAIGLAVADGVVAFEDTGVLLPGGRSVPPHRCPQLRRLPRPVPAGHRTHAGRLPHFPRR
jgi:hypothetical protein